MMQEKKMHWTSPWLRMRQEGIIWCMSPKNTSKGEQIIQQIFKCLIWKSIWSVFSPCASFIFTPSVQSDSQRVRTGRAAIGWQTRRETYYHTRNHHHQTPLTVSPSVKQSRPSTCVLFWQSLKGMRGTISVSHPQQWRPHKHAHCGAQVLTYAGI